MKYFLLSAVLIFFTPLFSFAAQLDYSQLVNYLQNQNPSSYKILSSVEEVYKKRLAFKQKGQDFRKGQELLVLKEIKGKSSFVFPVKAIVQVQALTKKHAIARVIKKITGEIRPQDPVSLPTAPRIYLRSNIKDKNSSEAYNRLLQTLLSYNYQVVEQKSESRKPQPDSYSILLELERSGTNLAAKIESLYTKSTLFSQVVSVAGKTKTAQVSPSQTWISKPKKGIQEQKPQKSLAPQKDLQPQPNAIQASTERYQHKLRLPRLPRKYQRLTTAQLNNTPAQEIILMNSQGIVAYTRKQNRLQRLDSFFFKKWNTVGLHLHSMDLDQDGTAEILATCGKKVKYLGAQDTKINSLALDWNQDKFSVLDKNLPFYLRVVQTQSGEQILLGQKKEGPRQYQGSIFRVNWDGHSRRLSPGKEYQPTAHIYSLYQFVLLPNSNRDALILEPNDFISLYHLPNENLLSITDFSFGAYKEIPYMIKPEKQEYRDVYDKVVTSKETFLNRRFVLKRKLQNQSFLIKKNRKLPSFKRKITNYITQKNVRDSIVALKCSENRIYQSWESKKIPRDIIDFCFFEQENSINLMALVRDKQGYALEILASQEKS